MLTVEGRINHLISRNTPDRWRKANSRKVKKPIKLSPFWWSKFGATMFRFVTRKQHSVFWKRTVFMKTYLRSVVIQGQCCYWLSLISTALNRPFLTKNSIKRSVKCCFQPEIIILLQRIWDLKTADFSFLILPHPCTHKCVSSDIVGGFYCWWLLTSFEIIQSYLLCVSLRIAISLWKSVLSLQRRATRWERTGKKAKKGKPHYGKEQHLHLVLSKQWHEAI